VPPTLSIPGRFNGPLTSGHGGYCSAAIGEFVDGDAEVTLRSPVPLDTPLEVAHDGGTVRVLDGETLIAEATRAPELSLEVPDTVSAEEARDAASRYRGAPDGMFGNCFVCGRGRHDALGVFAGAVDDRELAASPWTPPSWTADDEGHVMPEFVWSVLDCPTYFALYTDGSLPLSFLGRMTARVEGQVVAGTEHVVMAWPIESDGRKRLAGAAVLSPAGDPLAAARVLMIEPREGSAE
jgi:hypothetical protein